MALTLIEMVVSIVLVGVMMVAALNTLSAAKLGQQKLYDRRQGYELAEALLTEVLAQPYADETQMDNLRTQILVNGTKVSQTLGRESGETATDRSLFDDVDDYNGWTETPPQLQDGTALAFLTGWKRTVTVEFVASNDAATTKTQDEGAKRITVSVAHNEVPVATLVALRTLGPTPTQFCCLADGSALDMRAADCTAAGGTAGGVGTNTLNMSCKKPITAVAHWKFDENSGTTAADSAGGHTATISGATWAGGQLGNALNFTKDIVTVPHDNALSLDSALTISAWIKLSGVSGGTFSTIIQKGCANNPVNYYLSHIFGEVEFGFYRGAWYQFRTSGVGLVKNKWRHVAVTYDMNSGEIFIYVDGVQTLAATATIAPVTNTSEVNIGGTCKNEDFAGLIDDLQIYNVVLTVDQINNVMNGLDP